MDVNIHFSDFFNVHPKMISEYGAFNISLVNDLPLFIDPFLLFNSSNKEYRILHNDIIKYVKFLRDVSHRQDLRTGLLEEWFYFSEVKQTWFGYSQVGNRGSGLGKNFARALNTNLHAVFTNFGDEEITQGSHLEKLCLINEGVGKDNISDFTTNLIKGFLLKYTENFAINHIDESLRKTFSIRKVRFNYDTRTWESEKFNLPIYMNDYIILTPKNILTKDDTWINKHDLIKDFEDVIDSLSNENLRANINTYIIHNLPVKAKRKDLERLYSEIIIQNPEIIDHFIRYKEEHGDTAIDVSNGKVMEVENIYIQGINQFVDKLKRESSFYEHIENTYDATMKRVLFLKDIIENKDGYKMFYDGLDPIRREADLQLFFRLTWYASIFDVNREVNNGRGPVDYKISNGNRDSTLVEFKLASNTQLRRNLERQVEIYEKASNPTNPSIKVIIYFSEKEFLKLEEILKQLNLYTNKHIITIDARSDNKPSASIA